jgi:hypothetical protein
MARVRAAHAFPLRLEDRLVAFTYVDHLAQHGRTRKNTPLPKDGLSMAFLSNKTLLDYFLPMPVQGSLVSNVWGAPGSIKIATNEFSRGGRMSNGSMMVCPGDPRRV